MNFNPKYLSFIICLLAGMLYALGFPTFFGASVFIAPIIGFATLNWVLDRETSLKQQFILSLAYSLGFYLFGFYWIPHTLMEFGGIFFPFNQMLGLLFSFVIIPQIYCYVILKKYIKHPIILAIGYVLLERFVPQQFPAHLGHPFLSLAPSINLIFAPWAGSAFYSFLAAFIALTLVQHKVSGIKPKLYYGFIVVILFLHLPFFNKTPSKESLTSFKIRLIQPNIGNFLKINAESGSVNSIKTVLDNYYYLSTVDIQSKRDLIIWPETAFPNLFFSETFKNNTSLKLPPVIRNVISNTGAELFIGGYDTTLSSKNLSYKSDYNAAFLFSNQNYMKDVYHKMLLIPFGEGLPFGPLNNYLSEIITNISYFAEGSNYTGFKTDNNLNFVSVICYEVLFSSFVADMLNHQKDEAQFMINLTNDSWYGNTAEPFQHLFLTKWRALEFNIPVIRSTNTGITTVIFPDGSESPRLSISEKSYLDIDLEIAPRAKTIFQKFGIWSFLIIAFILLLIELAFKRKAFFQEIMKSNKA